MAKVEVCSEITGTIRKILVKEGETVEEDDTLMIIESMKMEIELHATTDGVVHKILVTDNDQISSGQVACIIDE